MYVCVYMCVCECVSVCERESACVWKEERKHLCTQLHGSGNGTQVGFNYSHYSHH